MTGGEYVAYGALTALVIVALVLFADYWRSLPDWNVATGEYVVVTLLIGYHMVAWLLRWFALPRMRRPSPPPRIPPGTRVAAVTTYVPDAESFQMLEVTLRALVEMEGDHETWILDEGDEPAVRALCIRYGAHHFTRKHRRHLRAPDGVYADATKHGNYNAWLSAVGYDRYDVVVSFDPDHVPEPQYLRRTVGYFEDPSIAFVQAPQVYYNQQASWIARGAAEETYDYYSAHQMASYGLGHPIVVGSHTAHRIAALKEVGGYAAHDADDLLITLLYRSAGWGGVYVPEALAVGLTPASWYGYMRQQARWTRSVLDIKIRELRGMATRLPVVDRLLGVLHGIFYLRPLTIPLAYLLLIYLLSLPELPGFLWPRSLAVLAGLAGFFALIGTFRQRFYLDPERERGLHWRAAVLQFAKWPAQVIAIWQLIRNVRVGYAVTLKVGAASQRELVLWPHLLFALLFVEAWLLGVVLTPPATLMRTALAGLVVGGSLILAWSETWRYPPAYDPMLYQRYRGERRPERRTA